ncbi:MAG TPA: hypothetical protein VJM75_06165, partial [Acidimicrobiales bacterium]|nr:hypothetical protein [Acidimicrobiales bacterium]
RATTMASVSGLINPPVQWIGVDPVLGLCVPDSHRHNHGQGPLGLLRCELVAQPLEPVELEGLTLREFLIRALQDRAEVVLRQRMESGKPPEDDER